jgi:A/G-specific adenine glycosylase
MKKNSSKSVADGDFAPRLLNWFDRHGRHDLPWQRERSAYHVWLSEIMLQQTQVATVIDYYQRFLQRFPDLHALAAAPVDDVLGLWAGLGYYARARNLHRCARNLIEEHGGEFPRDIETMQSLPGIGRSTAAAILAFTHEQPHAILDGNVKRVLARFHAVEGSPSLRAVEQQLWKLSEGHMPQSRVGDYTQAIMDLGATVCTRSRPRCEACPLHADCVAHQHGAVNRYPRPRERKPSPIRAAQFLIIRNPAGEVLLEARPPSGIWGGLWSLPELALDSSTQAWCTQQGLRAHQEEKWPVLRHTFTHYHLDIHPVLIDTSGVPATVMDADRWLWYKEASRAIGVPAPVRKLLTRLHSVETSPER